MPIKYKCLYCDESANKKFYICPSCKNLSIPRWGFILVIIVVVGFLSFIEYYDTKKPIYILMGICFSVFFLLLQFYLTFLSKKNIKYMKEARKIIREARLGLDKESGEVSVENINHYIGQGSSFNLAEYELQMLNAELLKFAEVVKKHQELTGNKENNRNGKSA